jgi:hypothetical protein
MYTADISGMDHHRQCPTHSCLRITSSNDAKAALFLVEAGVLERVRRRPDHAEKTLITHGSIFVWKDGAKGETCLEVGACFFGHVVRFSSNAAGTIYPHRDGPMGANGALLDVAVYAEPTTYNANFLISFVFRSPLP